MEYNPTYNPFSLKGKTILVTGASSGIGRATAIECSKLGAIVIITGRNSERLQQTYDSLYGLGHLQIIADLNNLEDLTSLVNQVPILDGVVNNAGIAKTQPISFIKEEDLQKIFATNTFTPILLVKQLLRKKKINKNASLVFTSSVSAIKSDLGNSVYGASKAALQSYVRYCARELAPKSIRANSIHPGMVNTPLITGGAHSDDDLQTDAQKYPLGRYGRPEEIAWSIIYLLSDASAWITGHSLIIDGGISTLI
ncbi:MAG: SDR family oxidoreductase [Paludibacteraceae bacterium]|nr:SDR family oxidoreductase [Paludibacteraceae bacterium]